jgi:alpha-N-arabinofuranosidase
MMYALASLRPSVLRWPGGCYADVYHWRDGIGHRSQRKSIKNIFWRTWGNRLLNSLSQLPGWRFEVEGAADFEQRVGHDINNQFGTVEFLTLCEEILALPYITVNYGSGTPEEAAEWVEYCNGSPSTYFGGMRVKHGRRPPFNVPIWGIGNEIYLENEHGHEKNPAVYGRRYLEYAWRMKEKDPGIKLVGCGWNRNNWNEGFLAEIDEEFLDYLSIHQYLPFPPNLIELLPLNHPEEEEIYYAMMAAPFEIKKQILKAWHSLVKRYGVHPRTKVAIDEWGIWYTIHDLVKTNYNLQDGLFAALVLLLFQKLSDICTVGLWSTLVNSLGMIRTDGDGLVLTPVYLVFKLFKEHTYLNLVDNILVETDLFNSGNYGQISAISGNPMVECSATTSDDGSMVSLMLINKHFSDSLTVNLRIRGLIFFRVGKIVELSGASPFTFNTPEDREAVRIREHDIDDVNAEMTLTLKPHSITVLKLTKLDLGLGG